MVYIKNQELINANGSRIRKSMEFDEEPVANEAKALRNIFEGGVGFYDMLTEIKHDLIKQQEVAKLLMDVPLNMELSVQDDSIDEELFNGEGRTLIANAALKDAAHDQFIHYDALISIINDEINWLHEEYPEHYGPSREQIIQDFTGFLLNKDNIALAADTDYINLIQDEIFRDEGILSVYGDISRKYGVDSIAILRRTEELQRFLGLPEDMFESATGIIHAANDEALVEAPDVLGGFSETDSRIGVIGPKSYNSEEENIRMFFNLIYD